MAFQYFLSVISILFKTMLTLGSLMTDACMVERVKEFCELEGHEGALKQIGDKELPSNWPHEGEVVIINLSVRYREGLSLVLKNLDLKVSGGSRVAVLGRTGSGKSTLMLVLMRILEPSSAGSRSSEVGTISIDDQDIAKVGLKRLRSSISMIPQIPFLMEGTLRFNLDQHFIHSDQEILRVLDLIGLQEAFKELTKHQRDSTESDNNEDQIYKEKDPQEILSTKI